MRKITHYKASRMQQLRRRAQRISDATKFVDASDGWFYRGDEPMKLLRLFPRIHLKDGYILHGCRYFANGNGNGIVCATKNENGNFNSLPMVNGGLDPVPISPEEFESIEGTLADFMEALQGDGTPWSYFSASILARELQEYGALWHGASWSTHTLLDAPPWEIIEGQDPDSEDDDECMDSFSPKEVWTWIEDEPDDWRPRVEFLNGQSRVTFYTFSALGQEQITKFVDTYSPNAYTFDSEQNEIAHGGGGYIF